MKTTVTIDPRFHDAVGFDLDGVATDTASIQAFDDVVPVFDSISRMHCPVSRRAPTMGHETRARLRLACDDHRHAR